MFGSRADSPTLARRRPHRVVISQNGPGDEIQLASTYPYLESASAKLTVFCEPRLESLMRRSFPSIDFVPTIRQTSRRHPGFLAGMPARARINSSTS